MLKQTERVNSSSNLFIWIVIANCLTVLSFSQQNISSDDSISCHALIKNHCSLCYISISPITFKNCTVSCLYEPLNSSLFPSCLNNSKFLADQAQCFRACCSTDYSQEDCVNNDFTNNNSSLALMGIILMVCASGLLLVGIPVGVYLYLIVFNSCKKKLQLIQVNQQGEIWWKKNTSSQQTRKNKGLQRQATIQNLAKLQQQIVNPCSICLQEHYQNLKTNCNHSFHFKCFVNWLKQNQSCPLCVRKSYNPIKIECQACHQKQIRCRLYKRNSHLQKYQFMKESIADQGIKQQLRCPQCKLKQKYKQQIPSDSITKNAILLTQPLLTQENQRYKQNQQGSQSKVQRCQNKQTKQEEFQQNDRTSLNLNTEIQFVTIQNQ